MLPELAVDAFLVTALTNVRYLTGFTGSNGQVLVAGPETVFFTDGRYIEQARHEVPDLERVAYLGSLRAGARRAGCTSRDRTHGVRGASRDGPLPRATWRRRCRASNWWPSTTRSAASVGSRMPTRWPTSKQRRSRPIRRSRTSWSSWRWARPRSPWHVGSNCCSAATGPTDSASTPSWRSERTPPNLITSRTTASSRKAMSSSWTSAPLYAGYHADMTRTVSFGEPPSELKKIHDVVKQSQQAGIDAVGAGASGRDVDDAARSVIDDAGLRRRTSRMGSGTVSGLTCTKDPAWDALRRPTVARGVRRHRGTGHLHPRAGRGAHRRHGRGHRRRMPGSGNLVTRPDRVVIGREPFDRRGVTPA